VSADTHGQEHVKCWESKRGREEARTALSLFIGMLGQWVGVCGLDPGTPSFILLATLVLSIYSHIQRMLIDPLKINPLAVPPSFICECPENVTGAVRVIFGRQRPQDYIAN